MRAFWNINNVYRYRDDNLLAMGYPSYRAYLKSDLWRSIRARVLAARPLCEGCAKRQATQVHHRAYDPVTLRGENLNALTAICRRCHYVGERPFQDNQDAADRLARANRAGTLRHKAAAARVRQGQTFTKPDDTRVRRRRKARPEWEQGPRRAQFPRAALSTMGAPRLVKPSHEGDPSASIRS